MRSCFHVTRVKVRENHLAVLLCKCYPRTAFPRIDSRQLDVMTSEITHRYRLLGKQYAISCYID